MTLLKCACVAMLAVGSSAAFANEYDADLRKIAMSQISDWVASPEVVTAVQDQNARTMSLSQEDVDALDATWRAQTVSGGELIDSVLGNSLSQFLKSAKQQGQGQFTEIFVSDIRGLNVGQSDVTSDYWQGDEAKWQVPHETSDLHISDIEFDESTQSYQSQVSLPILHEGAFIGVITVGVDLDRLAALH